MKCQNCDSELKKITTDLPFKTKQDSIVIVKSLPVLQCDNCSEFLIEDSIMEQVEQILANTNKTAELEILHYAP